MELNYGQGEGQFDIGGIEVGIYVSDSGFYHLVIHDTVESRWEESLALVEAFRAW